MAREFARIIKRGRVWAVPNDRGYAAETRKSKAGAVRLARQMYPGRPVHVMEQGPMVYGRAQLVHVETIA